MICMRCDTRPRTADSALCQECQDAVKQGRPLGPPVGCFFCSPGNRRVPDVATGPLCDRCRAQLRGLREYLRTVCSTLEPLGPE